LPKEQASEIPEFVLPKKTIEDVTYNNSIVSNLSNISDVDNANQITYSYNADIPAGETRTAVTNPAVLVDPLLSAPMNDPLDLPVSELIKRYQAVNGLRAKENRKEAKDQLIRLLTELVSSDTEEFHNVLSSENTAKPTSESIESQFTKSTERPQVSTIMSPIKPKQPLPLEPSQTFNEILASLQATRKMSITALEKMKAVEQRPIVTTTLQHTNTTPLVNKEIPVTKVVTTQAQHVEKIPVQEIVNVQANINPITTETEIVNPINHIQPPVSNIVQTELVASKPLYPALQNFEAPWPNVCQLLRDKAARQFKALAHLLSEEKRNANTAIVAFCGYDSGHGTTTLLLETSRELVAHGKHVLIIDVNFDNPAMLEQFGVAAKHGWEQLLAPEVFEQREPPILYLTPESIAFLPLNRKNISAATSFLKQYDVADVIRYFTNWFDHIIIDAGNVGKNNHKELITNLERFGAEALLLVQNPKSETKIDHYATLESLKLKPKLLGIAENYGRTEHKEIKRAA
jgi:Mrp family chromosome partitioning ATPase